MLALMSGLFSLLMLIRISLQAKALINDGHCYSLKIRIYHMVKVLDSADNYEITLSAKSHSH
jgi:hypothetical protein